MDAARAAPSDRFLVPSAPSCAAPLIVGVTAHRNLVEAEIAPLRARIDALFDELGRRFPDLPLVVLSALAKGGDLLVAEQALARGVRVIAVLPMPAELYARDFDDAADRAAFDELCRQARPLQLPLVPGNTLDGIAEPGDQRDLQYAEAGIFIASHCHVLLALWDGRASDLPGGTAQIVRYHLDGIPPGVVTGHQRAARPLLARADESLAYHIACSRREADGSVRAPLAPLQPLQERWLSQTGARCAQAGMPDEFQPMFRRMVQFNRDMQIHRDAIAAHASAQAAGEPVGAGGLLSGLFVAADWLAEHFHRRVLLALRGIHVLAALMGIAFVAYAHLPGNLFNLDPLIDVFVALFAAGVLLDRLDKKREWHRKYIDYRALAEGLRVQRYWSRAGVSAGDSTAFAHDDFLHKQDVEIGWIRNVMRAASLQATVSGDSGPMALGAVIDDWIGAPDDGGQLGYYARKSVERSRMHHAARRVVLVCLWTGMAFGAVLAVFHRALAPDVDAVLVAVMGMLAIIAAARESYSYRKADKELVEQYRCMRDLFAAARRAVDGQPDPRAQRNVLRALGQAALAEHAQWALMHRARPLEHGRL